MKNTIKYIAAILCICVLLCACGSKNAQNSKEGRESDTEIIIDALRTGSSQEADEDQPDSSNKDSDFDRLSDDDENLVYQTDPLNPDTDGDGVDDYLEIVLGLDPLKSKSDGKTPDAKRSFEKTYTRGDATLSIEGVSNSVDAYIEETSLPGFENMPGVYSPVYELYNEHNSFDSASLTISYDEDLLTANGANPDNLRIYQLKDDGSFVEVGGKVDVNESSVSVELPHFSMYFVADSTKVSNKQETDVFLLIDNSGSMYPIEMCESSYENDVDFKRVDMAQRLISMTDDSVNYAVAKFTGSFTPLITEFTNDKEKLCAGIDTIKTDEEVFNGTYIATSLVKSAQYFKEYNDHRKFIIMLTDGRTTENVGLFSWSFYDEDDAISLANKYGISIIVIGLGNSLDTDYLTKIANGTGGYYIYANDADALDKICETLMAAMTYGFVDTDGDGANDQILLADSGFNVEKDGWQMRNYLFKPTYEDVAINGQCAGLAIVAQLWYRYHSLPLEAQAVERYRASGLLRAQYLQSDGYDISNVAFFNNGDNAPLSKLSFFSELDALLSKESKYVYKRDPRDQSHIVYSDEIQDIIDRYPNLIQVQTNPCEQRIWGCDNKVYTSTDSIVYTLYGVDYNELTAEEKPVYDTLQMINYYYSIQGKEELFHITDLQSSDYTKDIREKNFQELLSKLSSGIPLVVKGPDHAATAIRITRSIDNPNEYDLAIYDNNRPNKECHIRIEKYVPSGLDALDLTSMFNKLNYRFIDLDGVFTKKGEEVSLKFAEYLCDTAS